MFELLFAILMFAVFGKILFLAIKATWSITKILLTVVLLPIVLIALAAAGLIYIAFLGLIIVGLVTFLVR